MPIKTRKNEGESAA